MSGARARADARAAPPRRRFVERGSARRGVGDMVGRREALAEFIKIHAAALCCSWEPETWDSRGDARMGFGAVLGALSTLGIREERILDVFPDLPQDRTYAMQQLC